MSVSEATLKIAWGFDAASDLMRRRPCWTFFGWFKQIIASREKWGRQVSFPDKIRCVAQLRWDRSHGLWEVSSRSINVCCVLCSEPQPWMILIIWAMQLRSSCHNWWSVNASQSWNPWSIREVGGRAFSRRRRVRWDGPLAFLLIPIYFLTLHSDLKVVFARFLCFNIWPLFWVMFISWSGCLAFQVCSFATTTLVKTKSFWDIFTSVTQSFSRCRADSEAYSTV